ncbi:MAG: nucleoside phosphorylase [Syntrophobacteraceae bacterium]
MLPDKDSCLIDPRKGRSEQPLPSAALLVFSPEDLRAFLNVFSEPAPRSHKFYLSEVFTGTYNQTRIAVAGPMLGAPQTILVLEKMIALGAKRIVAAGWCGSLQKHVRIGDIVLPSAAISEEGTSRHYPAEAPGPSPDLFRSLAHSLTASGLTVHEGPVWTTDAPFRETFAKVTKFQAEGVLGVEMETSALFAVSSFRNVDLAVVLVVSDDLSGMKWVHGFKDPVFKESREKVVRSALEALCSASDGLTHS